jgi:hypothetical protein
MADDWSDFKARRCNDHLTLIHGEIKQPATTTTTSAAAPPQSIDPSTDSRGSRPQFLLDFPPNRALRIKASTRHRLRLALAKSGIPLGSFTGDPMRDILTYPRAKTESGGQLR